MADQHQEPAVLSSFAQLCSKENPPKNFELLFVDGQGSSTPLKVGESVRWIAGKRLVAKAVWQGQEVYAKLFFRHRRARSAWQREVKTLAFMAENKITAPNVLFSGTAEQERVFVVLMEPIAPAVTLGDLWGKCQGQAEKMGLLQKMMQLLASHHACGLAQRDLHWNNFLQKDDDIYTLDAGDITIHDSPLEANDVQENLSQFFSLLLPVDDSLMAVALDFYNDLPSTVQVSSEDVVALAQQKRCVKHKKYTQKKIFRKCTEFFCNRTFNKVVLCNRDYHEDIAHFLFNPDDSFDFPESEKLKSGHSCTVWLVETATQKYVVKRYNIKGFWHGFGRLFRPTNGAASWKGGHLLGCYGIATPKPVAFIEERFGIFRRRAYVITEYVEGINFWNFFFDQKRSFAEKKEIALQVKPLFDILRQTGIRHGDLKGQNLFVTKDGVSLIDLDDLRQFNWLAKYWHQRDCKRFMRNWEKDAELHQLFAAILGI